MEKHRFTIHSNGDDAETMKKNFVAVLDAAQALEEALRKTTPSARNYYVKLTAEEDLRDDRNEYVACRRNLQAIKVWAEEGAMHVIEQEGQ